MIGFLRWVLRTWRRERVLDVGELSNAELDERLGRKRVGL